MIIEMHCHTAEFSACSHVAAADLVQSNFDKGLDGTVITDHHHSWSSEELRELRSRLRVPDYYLILSGQEVECPDLGHVLVYGANASIEANTALSEIRGRFPKAAIVWAHPYRNENIPARDKLMHPLINGIELFSSNHTVAENNRALRDWHRYKFTGLSGTDTHGISYSALYPTFFDHPVSTIQELADEIKAGRCKPYFRESSRSGTSNTQVTEVMIGRQSAGKSPEKFVVRSHEDEPTWRSSARAIRVIEEIRQHGFDTGPFRVPKQLGQDLTTLTVIEQGIHGKSLFDALAESDGEDARLYLRMAAEWLARLHNARLRITPPSDFLREEPSRLEYYLTAFYKTDHPQTRRAQEIMDTVIDMEMSLYCRHQEKMSQGHGDYHPRNIFIGKDDESKMSTLFVAAIDFNSSYSMPPAFDVGTFLAQFRNQFYGHRDVLSKVAAEAFLEAYLHAVAQTDRDFLSQVELFKARTALSIGYYLIKVGLGRSENMWRVLVEAGQILTNLQVTGMGTTAVIEPAREEKKSA